MSDLMPFIGRALTDPRRTLGEVLDLGVPRSFLWQAILLFTILRVLLVGFMGEGEFSIPIGETEQPVSPVTYGLILLAGLVAMVFIVHFAGNSLGGTGTFIGAIIVVTIVEGLTVLFVAAQVLALQLSAFLAAMFAIGGAVAVLVCTLIYIDELHGFNNMWKALGTLVLGGLVLVVGLSVLVSIIGVGRAFTSAGGI